MTWLLLVASTVAVVGLGPRLARTVEVLGERTGVGGVVVGAVLLGATTSLPGLVLTVIAAASGDVDLAVANAIGGVAAQTFFIAIADIAYREGTLSSGVPTREVSFQAALLIVLLSIVVIGTATPDVAFGRIHPATPALVVAYVVGLVVSRRLDRDPRVAGVAMHVSRTPVTGDDDRDPEGGHAGARGKIGEVEPAPATAQERQRATGTLWVRFALMAAMLAGAGVALARSGGTIATDTGLGAVAVGFVLTAIVSSTPELVTAVAAARRGAIGLAAGDIIGGNVFDVLFVAAADLASPTPIFSTIGTEAPAIIGLALLMNGLLLAGLVRQGEETRTVDVESVGIAVLWGGAVALLVVG